MRKSKCFISYCHDDVNSQEIEFLLNLLEHNTKKHTEFIIDYRLQIGKEFKDFMNLLDTVDLVIMICTPKYKLKTESNDKSSGVGYEYEIIRRRYEHIRKESKTIQSEYLSDRQNNFFEVLPVILKGNLDSIPIEFSGNRAIDLSYLKIRKSHSKLGQEHPTITKRIAKVLETDIDTIITTLNSIHTTKQKSYELEIRNNYDILKFEPLFKDTKADFQNPRFSKERFEDRLFVRTHVYKQIENQSAYFLIGRKGSGKSAITQILPLRDSNFESSYLGVVDIYANRDMNFNILYSLINKEFLSDTKNVFNRLVCFKYAWALFLRICIMDVVISTSEKSLHNTSKLKRIDFFLNELNKKQPITEKNSRKASYFTYSFNAILRYTKYCISNARRQEEYFLSDIQSQFNINSFIEFSLGADVNRDLGDYLEFIPKKILVTFDGFDTEIEQFREQGQFWEEDSIVEKVSFEIDWLHSLLILVNDIKQMKTGKEILDSKLDFCLTIPNHRYIEILRNDIDSYRFQGRRKNLIWTGVELLIFVRKRLEVLANYRTKNGVPFDRYDEVIGSAFPYVPKTINFIFNGKPINIDLFLYVLRHTFWRPRDILLYYSHLLVICQDAKQNGYKISSESIRTSIANLTFDIIKADFLNEYRGTVRNINDIVNSFHGSTQVLPFESVSYILHRLKFEFVMINNENICDDLVSKIKFLYQIGFIGVQANKDLIEKFNLYSEHIFIFNEGCKILKNANIEKLKYCNFIIHPIFCEFLELSTKGNEFIFDYSREYIFTLEGFMKASNEDFMYD